MADKATLYAHGFCKSEARHFVQLPYQTTDRMAVIMKETNFDYSNNFGLQASAIFSAGNGSTATCLPQAPTSTTKTAISSTFPSTAKNCLLSLAAQHP